MWSGNEEVNQDGQPVRLYHPIQYRRAMHHADDPTASFIGGLTSTKYKCPLPFCQQQPLVSLVQLYIPTTQRTYRVWACNSARCWRSLFTTSKFHVGGNGVVVCESIRAQPKTSNDNVESSSPPVAAAVASPAVLKKTDPLDDWGVTEEEEQDVGMEDLEAMLAAMETKQPNQQQSSSRPPKVVQSAPSQGKLSGFPMMPLASMQEPPARTVPADARDVGLHGTSNQKIQEMLARYMQEEEDQDIVQMLQGVGGVGNGGPMEVDEDLTPEEMALLRFSDRLKRAPRQVLRHAHGGEPLWSIPVPTSPNGSDPISIPPCASGAPRVFEFQILPSVLHMLNVDKHAAKQSETTASSMLNDWYSAGGMDFGSIAVYANPNPDDSGSIQKEFVVVQDTAEDQPREVPDGFRDAVEDAVVDESSAVVNSSGGDDNDDGDFVTDA